MGNTVKSELTPALTQNIHGIERFLTLKNITQSVPVSQTTLLPAFRLSKILNHRERNNHNLLRCIS